MDCHDRLFDQVPYLNCSFLRMRDNIPYTMRMFWININFWIWQKMASTDSCFYRSRRWFPALLAMASWVCPVVDCPEPQSRGCVWDWEAGQVEQGEPRGATIAAEARGSNRATLRQVFCHSARPGDIRDEHRNPLGHVEVLGLILFCLLYHS